MGKHQRAGPFLGQARARGPLVDGAADGQLACPVRADRTVSRQGDLPSPGIRAADVAERAAAINAGSG